MNRKMILHILGKMMGVEGLLLLIPALVGLIYQEKCAVYFVITAAVLAVIFLLTGRKKPENTMLYGKDGLLIVSSAWILWSLFGALPFFLSGSIPNYMDAFFETVSGFTTTGSTILKNVEVLPQCMTFWRSLTHWVGGMGVLVFVMVLTNLDKQSSIHLMRAEVPGPEKDKLVPKSRTTAQILYGMYFILTAIQVVLLLLGGMNLFDSLIHAFGTAGTGGFSNYADSVGHFDSAYLDGVISVFMILFGINFNLYFFLAVREFKLVFKNEELRAYLLIISGAVVMIMINIYPIYGSVAEAFRYSAFQVASIITTTGYATADYMLWPEFSRCVLVALMIIGACASSTGGGIKVSRLLISLKSIYKEIKQMLHPKSVNVVKLNKKKLGEDTIRNVYVYLLAYITLAIVSVLIVSLDNFDFETTVGSVITALGNVGPGLGMTGPVGSFADYSLLAKFVFCLDMLAGRLEIFPFLMLFSYVWRKKF
ncbi:potassium transporter KefA [Claveliimonas bilis]|uniref:Potassium transporter KefA n=1 Tax=Claveliimonas bilis TaxID=3028070 RepID=A0ABN6YXJ7_9FIRM|nr:TrkH family potassium uptake protein [Claveliimonas bilis]BCZ28058.1 potassium transporter KefA [Claveliimonas bilis]BDZ78111.1 potassium transporter KefA [Claveliimonas bilis]BDZ80977.1 potassium transporter KefA [Claveliimonas bilis]